MNRLIIAALFLIALFGACRKNFDITQDEVLGPIPTENVEASLTGQVVDEHGNAVEGALVQVAGQTLTTDNRGMFFVHQELMNKNGAYIHVSHDGYFNAARFAFPRLGKNAFIIITMTTKGELATFESNSGTTVNLLYASVNVPANAVAYEDGSAYSGPVKMFGVYLDPTLASTFRNMPGDLRAEDGAGFAKVLRTFGMIGVELESPSGQKLNLVPGKSAVIKMDVPGSILASAPTTIPTWHFNETNGYWEEEGNATLTGNQYVFEVPHFSFWNCDTPNNFIILNGRLVDQSGHPLSNYRVSITDQTYGTGYAYTDNEGYFGGAVPNDVSLQMTVDNFCSTSPVLEQTIGPFNNNTDLGNISVSVAEQVTVTGILLNCDMEPLENGLVTIGIQDTVISAVRTDENGQFTFSLASCTIYYNLSVIGIDDVNLLKSLPVDVNIIDNAGDAGAISVCSALDEFLVCTVDGRSKTFTSNLQFEFGIMDNGYVGAGSDQDTVYLSLGFENLSGMQASIQNVNGAYRDANNILQGYGCAYCDICNCGDLNAGTLQFTELPTAPGEYAAGTVSGMVRLPNNTAVPYSVHFRVKLQ